MGWAIFFFLLFIALCYGVYNKNRDECDKGAEECAEMIDPLIIKGGSVAAHVITYPFIKGRDVVKGDPNPEMDALKQQQEAELQEAGPSTEVNTSYEDWYENDQLYWNQGEWPEHPHAKDKVPAGSH